MFYYDTDERTGKRIGIVAAVVYVLFWAALCLFVKFSFAPPETVGNGILINFGDTEQAGGEQDLAYDEQVAPPDQPASTAPETSPEEVLTQDHEDAPVVTSQQEKDKQATESPTSSRPVKNEAPPQEKPREVNKRALFPGRTVGSNSQAEGTATGTGNQGDLSGSPTGSHEGTGLGNSGKGFDLTGRSVVGVLPDPVYGPNKEGRVIVTIVVDAKGVVKNASYRAQGSTTNDSELVSAAIRAAYKSRFNTIEGDGLQTGTITYNFKLK